MRAFPMAWAKAHGAPASGENGIRCGSDSSLPGDPAGREVHDSIDSSQKEGLFPASCPGSGPEKTGVPPLFPVSTIR